MLKQAWDVIIVGSRCAGSPTAMLLARKGYHVLLLDRATFPSDSIRAHGIQLSGVALLAQWGLLEQVLASNCPPLRSSTTDLDDFPLTGPVDPASGQDASYAPRRILLDKILVDAAVAAGAELRQGVRIAGLLTDGTRITGVQGQAQDGTAVVEHAPLVIGADGTHSIVARMTQAPVYQERAALTCAYYSYFSGVPLDGLAAAFRPACFCGAFQTNDGLTGVAVQVPLAAFPAFRADIEGTFYRYLAQVPWLEELVRAGRREERWRGTADLPNGFRKPYGPGWALVGDPGYSKDPITALGISDAFRDADLLAGAVDDGLSGRVPLEDALAAYEQRRNEVALPQYVDTCARAAFEPFSREVLATRAAMSAQTSSLPAAATS